MRIGAFDEPGERTINLGIPTPAVANQNYELKTSLINMVQGSKFYGLPSENPLHHLDQFERLCRTVKINGIPQDAIKMMLFPFSLGDRAAQWEQNVTSDLVSTWTLCKKEFTNKFFPKQKTTKIRNDITTFRQGPTESFYEAWDRLKGYTRACPHHGVEKDALLGIFHGGVHEKYRIALDTASYGSFANLDVDQGEQLIENLAQSNQCYGGDYDRALPARVDDQKLKELTEKLDRLDKALKLSQRQVNFVGQNDGCRSEFQDGMIENMEETPEEVNFVGNQGNYQYKPFNNNLSYRSQNVENPQDQIYPPFPKQQGNSYQNQGQGNFQSKPFVPQGQGNNYQKNYQGQQNNANRGHNNYQQAGGNSGQTVPDNEIKLMLKQLLEGQGTTKKEIAEMRACYGNLNSKFEGLATHVKGLENQIAQVATASRNTEKGILPGNPEPNPKEYCQAITLRMSNDFHKAKTAVRNPEIELSEEEHLSEDDIEEEEYMSDFDVEEEEVVPKRVSEFVFLPGKVKEVLSDRHKALLETLQSKIKFDIPLIRSFLKHPLFPEPLKDALKERKKELKSKGMGIRKDNTIGPMKFITDKEADPGRFTLPCALGNNSFPRCLCDLGASINVMPLSTATSLGFTEFKECDFDVVLADRSTARPVGLIENLPVEIRDYMIAADFVVMKMSEETRDPLVFGRPFLATTRAVIDVRKKKIHLKLGNEILEFGITKGKDPPTMTEQVSMIEELEILKTRDKRARTEETEEKSFHRSADEIQKEKRSRNNLTEDAYTAMDVNGETAQSFLPLLPHA